MKVEIHADMHDDSTWYIASLMRDPFKALEKYLERDYGGTMEHLWIELEFSQSLARSDGKSRYAFRFQKRVSGRSRFGIPATPDSLNVGHYSVRPDLSLIRYLPEEQLLPYFLRLLYDSTKMLLDKQKRLGGFNAVLFRKTFLDASESLGHKIVENAL